MHQCPSCKNQSISYGAAWNSGSRHPTMCPACRELSYVPSPESRWPLLGALCIMVLSGVVAALSHSMSVAIGGFALAMIYYIVRWRMEQVLVPFDPLVLVNESPKNAALLALEAVTAFLTFQ
jgi:hypothetical protein